MSWIALTYRDYAALPDDGRRNQILDGELCVTPAPGTQHQGISMKLSIALGAHVDARAFGQLFAAPTDVILSDTTIVQPDLVFVARDRRERVSTRGIEGAPTLVVEILSPSTAQTDRLTKRELMRVMPIGLTPKTTIRSLTGAASGIVVHQSALTSYS